MTHARQREMFANRLAKNARHRRKWARRKGISCYRLYDRDIPEVPLALDLYEGRAVLSDFGVFDDEGPDWLEAMADEVRRTVAPTELAVKHRRRQRGADQYDKLGERGERIAVGEGGHRFWVNLHDYLDTGLFLDHRQTRALVAAEAPGRRMLNVFSYTGSFTVYAAAAGAAATVSVDLSRTYSRWAADNLELNDIDPAGHEIVCADVFDYLESSVGVFDLAVVDPPVFSNSKKMDRTFDVQRDHLELFERLRRRLVPGARVFFSTPRRKLALDTAGLESLGFEVAEITGQTVPEDFARRRPHRAFLLELR